MRSSKAEQLRTALMEDLRYEKKHYILASEVKYNRCLSDILSIRNNLIHEIEVKISKADFIKDFSKKLGSKRYRNQENKHSVYTKSASSKKFVPHYFWFAVPENLAEYAEGYCLANGYEKYGIIIWAPGKPIRYHKNPRKLTSVALNKRVEDKIIKRATSELVSIKRDYMKALLDA